MLKTIILSAGLFISVTTFSETIELVDGTIIVGDVTSLNGGVYLINTSSLGQVRIEQSKVRSISKGKVVSSSGNDLSINSIVNIPKAMTAIQTLQNDPQIKAILADPELMRLISSGDLNALQSNPKIQGLMANPNVRSITTEIIGK
ncbi:hypothetical protein [Spartinivicinus ruber]|uniref:hypothetical protein n=1 Tax=Spartinivicinus ruber TaxID=2683272 RepID=UPI0013D5B7B8|nr:hypothetical protein [Spartinivicinus ruber]